MRKFVTVLIIGMVSNLLTAGAQDTTSLKDDLKALQGGQWQRPADKGPDWVRLVMSNPEKGEFSFWVWIYPDQQAKEKPLQGFTSGAVLQEEKKNRFIYDGDDKNKISYQFKGNKLILKGKYTNGSAPRKVLDLSGEWVKVDSPKKKEQK